MLSRLIPPPCLEFLMGPNFFEGATIDCGDNFSSYASSVSSMFVG